MKLIVHEPSISKYITPIRVKIIKKLIEYGEIQQKQLAKELKLNDSTLTYNLKILKELGIITKKKKIIEKDGYFKKVNIIKYNEDNNIIELEVL